MRPIIFLIILVIIVSSSVVSRANSCPPIPSSIVYGSGGAQIERLNAWCKSVGGTPNNNGSAWSCVNCPTSTATSSTSSGYTIYDAAVDDFLRWLFSPNTTQAAQRRAALKQQLEAERQAAIARKQAEEVARLDAILLRLSSSLKGFNTSNDLQLKLSPTGPIKFTEYMATPATQTTSARLELKTGDEATRSLETPKPNASSAGVINTTPPTPLEAPTFDASQLSPEAKELAEMLSKLTPEQQHKLIETIKSVATAEQPVATATTEVSLPPNNSGNAETKTEPGGLQLKVTDAKTGADQLSSAAKDPNTPAEQLSVQAAKDFEKLQQVSGSTPVAQPSNASPSQESKLTSQQPTTPASAGAMSSASTPVFNTPTIQNTALSQVMKKKIEVPFWRPEGWVGQASKGERTLKDIEDLQKKRNCETAEQQEILARLVLRSNQLAGVERLINRLNATSPRLQAEINETITAIKEDRDEFIDSVISKLTEQASQAQTLMKDPAFIRERDMIVEMGEFAENVGEYIQKIQTLRNAKREDKIALLQDMLPGLLVKLEPKKLAALKRKFGPQIRFATEWYDVAEVTFETIETFAKIALHGIEVNRLDGEIDARNKALASLDPLYRRLSNEVDALRHHPSLTACSTVK